MENLTLTGQGNVSGTGNTLPNRLIGNSGANLLDGKTGADEMAGGGGDDAYVVDVSGDTVSEAIGSGADTVRSAVDFTLGANLENLVLTGSAGLKGTGNECLASAPMRQILRNEEGRISGSS